MSFKKHDKRFLKGAVDFRAGPKLEAQVIFTTLSSLDCPRSLTVWLLYESGEHEQLADLEFDPLAYNSLSEIRKAYSSTKLLSKFKGLTLDRDLKAVALKKFMEFELLCAETNRRFRDLAKDPKYTGPVVWLHNAVIRKIERILGQFDPIEFMESPDWGPGASTLIKRRDASSARKFQCETGITRDLYSLLPAETFEMNFPLWSRHLGTTDYPSFQVGSKVITVTKDATTDRVIGIEPGINLWFQKSLGSMIVRRLLRFGVDLKHGQQRDNQRLAKLGSLTGEVATVDLRSASDSEAYAIMEALLPPRWFSVMDSCRTKYGLIEDKWIKWEKFSSMGNGFTFALESLVFFAITQCCVEYVGADLNQVCIYGDDIILPVSAYDLLSQCLDFYGFRINEKKSHYRSPFRESCGAHFYSGFDVKPTYFKSKLTSILTVYRLANAFRRQSLRLCNNMACDSVYRRVFELLVSKTPKGLRLRIPEGLGDGGFISNFDEATPSRARHGVEGYRVTSLQERSVHALEERDGYHLSVLWDMSKRSELVRPASSVPLTLEAMFSFDNEEVRKKGRNSVPLHDTRLEVLHSVTRRWLDLGPWVGNTDSEDRGTKARLTVVPKYSLPTSVDRLIEDLSNDLRGSRSD